MVKLSQQPQGEAVEALDRVRRYSGVKAKALPRVLAVVFSEKWQYLRLASYDGGSRVALNQ